MGENPIDLFRSDRILEAMEIWEGDLETCKGRPEEVKKVEFNILLCKIELFRDDKIPEAELFEMIKKVGMEYIGLMCGATQDVASFCSNFTVE